MDFVAEFFLEILGEAVVEGGVNAASDRRRPKWLRGLILALLGLFAAAVFAVIFLVGLAAVRAHPLISLALFALDGCWAFLCVRKLRKILRTFSHQ